MSNKYKDIIHLERPKSHRDKMSMSDRAAQFSPFAALSGHYEAICETHRYVDSRIVLDENKKDEIKYKLDNCISSLDINNYCSITYFIKDSKKNGGYYITENVSIKKYDEYRNVLVTDSGIVIKIEDILEFDYGM